MGRGSRRNTSASGRLTSRNQQCGKVLTHNRADLLYSSSRSVEKQIFAVPPRRRKKNGPAPPWGNIFTVPSRRRKKYLPSRPAEGKNIYRPFKPEEKILTVPSRRQTCPEIFYRPIPWRDCGPAVPFRPVNFSCLHFTVPSRPAVVYFPAKQEKSVPSHLATILSHFDKAWFFIVFISFIEL